MNEWMIEREKRGLFASWQVWKGLMLTWGDNNIPATFQYWVPESWILEKDEVGYRVKGGQVLISLCRGFNLHFKTMGSAVWGEQFWGLAMEIYNQLKSLRIWLWCVTQAANYCFAGLSIHANGMISTNSVLGISNCSRTQVLGKSMEL